MKSSTNTLIDAMKILASEIQSQDGVANAAILEASERLNELMDKVAELEREVEVDNKTIAYHYELMSKSDKRIAELEQYLENVKTLSIYVAFHDSAQSVSLKQAREWLESLKLEQQAKALEELLTYPNHRFHGDSRVYYSEYSINRAIENLRKQAKGGDV